MSSEHADPGPTDEPQPASKGRPGRRARQQNPHGPELAAAALAGGATQAEAATAASVHPRTVRKWLANEKFRGRIEELRSAAVRQALGRLSARMTTAADVLAGLMDSADEHVRHKAAKAVIELAVRLTDHTELDRRLKDIETMLRIGTPTP